MTDVASGIAEGPIGGLEIESSSVSATGFSAEEDSDLGLILGVSIPVGILSNFCFLF